MISDPEVSHVVVGRNRKKYNFIQKFFRSKPHEYFLLKFPVGAIFGAAIGYGYYRLTFAGAFDKSEERIDNFVFFGLLFITTIGCASSVQCRCIAMLCVPTMFGKTGKTVLKALLTGWILAGPVTNMIFNVAESVRSVTCVVKLQSQQMEKLIYVIHTPITAGLTRVVSDMHYLNESEHKFDESILKLKQDLWKRSRERSSQNQHKKKETNTKAPFKEPKDPSKKLHEDAYASCIEMFKRGVKECKRLMNKKKEECYNTIRIPIIKHILCAIFQATFVCNVIRWFEKTWCSKIPNPDHDAVNKNYSAMSDFSQEMDDQYQVKMKWKVPILDEDTAVMTPKEIANEIESDIKYQKEMFGFMVMVVKKLIAISFVFVFLAAKNYNTSYLTDFRFDNLYVTSYFKRKDKERLLKGKRCILPLKRIEKRNVIHPLSLKMTAAEKKSMTFRLIKWFAEVLFLALVLFFDYVIFFFLDLVKRHAKVDMEIRAKHLLEVHIEGNQTVANLLKRLFLPFKNNVVTVESNTTNLHCLPHAKKLSDNMYYWVGGMYGVFLLIILLDAYTLRLRHVIAGYSYRRREKRRIVHLYNDLMRRRKNHVVHVRMVVQKLARNFRLKQKYSATQAIRLSLPSLEPCFKCLGIGARRCIICEMKEKPKHPLIRCNEPKCAMLYCRVCWEEVGYTCWACKYYNPTEEELEELREEETNTEDDEDEDILSDEDN